MTHLEFESHLQADAATVWRHAVSVGGIRHEMGPWLTMTFPAGIEGLDDVDLKLNARLFRSWLLLFGVLPVDYDDLGFEAFEPGRRFQENSTMLSQRVWRHERVVEPFGNGCRVIDRLGFQPRIPGSGTISRLIIGAFFRHRHARLRGKFGVLPAPSPEA